MNSCPCMSVSTLQLTVHFPRFFSPKAHSGFNRLSPTMTLNRQKINIIHPNLSITVGLAISLYFHVNIAVEVFHWDSCVVIRLLNTGICHLNARLNYVIFCSEPLI